MDLFAKLPELGSFLAPPKPKAPALPADPGLPTDLLPPVVESWFHASATLAGVPPVMVTMPFLAGTGGVIGHRLGLELHPTWIEYPSLWIALVALTGTGKSPALAAARRPFDLLHDEWLASEHPTPLITTHAPWPQLQATLQSSTGHILLRDELIGLVRAIDRRSGEDRQRYLSLWSGDPLVFDGQPSVYHPVVSIIGGIQPLLLHRIRSPYQDGLLERFLLVLAGAPTVPWNPALPTTAPDLAPLLVVLRQLRTQSPFGRVAFDSTARDLWKGWYDAQITLTKPAPLILGGFYRKLPVHLARLTLVLHALWHPYEATQPVSRDTLDRAITLIEYLRIQLHRSLVLINEKHPHRSPATLLVDRIEEVLREHQSDHGWLGQAKLAAAVGRPASTILSAALGTLLDAGRIEQRDRPASGRGRPGTQYRLGSVE